MADIISMGGHGPYVWAAYGIAFVVLMLNVIWPLVSVRRNLAALRQSETATMNSNALGGSGNE